MTTEPAKTTEPLALKSNLVLGPNATDQAPLSALRGIARGSPQVTRCEWCGEYTRKPCQCPAEVEIERLRVELADRDGEKELAIAAEASADEYRKERDDVALYAADLHAALARLVAAYEARQLLTLNRAVSGTTDTIADLMDRRHRAERNAENEFCHAMTKAKMALGA